MNFGLVFPFSELNTAVFQNAAIYHRILTNGDAFAIFAPTEILGCYFHSSQQNPLRKLPFQNYHEVSNYVLKPSYRHKPWTWFTGQAPNYAWQKMTQRLPSSLIPIIPPYLLADYKMRRYLFRSGIYTEAKRWCKRHNLKFLGSAHNLDIESMLPSSKINTINWDLRFNQLARMVQNKGTLNHHLLSMQFYLSSNFLSSKDKLVMQSIESFLEKGLPVVWIRTRNILGPAAIHNTDPDFLLTIVSFFLKQGFSIICTGTPSIKLDLRTNNFFQLDYDLPVVVQQFFAARCKYVVTSAEAGLFTAWAVTEIPLVTFGTEWSVTNTKSKTSLLESRRRIGIYDLNLGEARGHQMLSRLNSFI